ncbi:universal stress protein [Iamia sp. SCSIO 61187]|uniref:universal stress protein n=1 Tax=Iamia sp. SCSIO 61187 TaxID=2722752 RepID=UPI001C624BD3|nr:universal stress protein [Iamia sp. SCSIO 61187]QYG92279.1 universal stress protein [Iamia sp. SCSIO 61187]
MCTTIVVPIDDGPTSERSVPVAGALARLTGATVELLSVDTDGSAPAQVRRRLDDLVGGIPAGVPVCTTVEGTTEPVAGVIAHLDRDPDTLVCLATRGRGALVSLALGSVTTDVVSQTHLQVLVVGPGCASSPPPDLTAPAVVALDGSDVDEDVMVTAAGWAHDTGAPLTVTTTITRPYEPEVWVDADRILAWAEARAAELGVGITTSLVASTDVGAGVLRAIEGPIGCIVVGSHRRGRIGRIVLGSTVTRLTHQAPCPVLVAGDRSPHLVAAGPDALVARR